MIPLILLLKSLLRIFCPKGNGISIIIPFRCFDENDARFKNLNWVKAYWRAQLPGSEVIVSTDPSCLPFSKSVAINNGVAQATGDVLVLVDADGYIAAHTILTAAKEIRVARRHGKRLWFVPYRHFYRLTEAATRRVLHSSPKHPYQFPCPPSACDILDTTGSCFGHRYGAMIQILPIEAFRAIGCWDSRFRGWGGEDSAAMRATDTLYWPHKTLPGQVLHLWHPMISPAGYENFVHWKYRMWEGQTSYGANEELSGRYHAAYGSVSAMRKLADEAKATE